MKRITLNPAGQEAAEKLADMLLDFFMEYGLRADSSGRPRQPAAVMRVLFLECGVAFRAGPAGKGQEGFWGGVDYGFLGAPVSFGRGSLRDSFSWAACVAFRGRIHDLAGEKGLKTSLDIVISQKVREKIEYRVSCVEKSGRV